MSSTEENDLNNGHEAEDDPNQVTLSIDEDHVFRIPVLEMGD